MDKDQPNIRVSDIDSSPLETRAAAPSAEEYDALSKKFTEVSNENFTLKQEVDQLTKRVNTTTILDSLIEPYAARAYWFMVGYCLSAGALLWASSDARSGIKVADSVLQILVGSTAVTVIGLVGMVLTGIFVGARRTAPMK